MNNKKRLYKSSTDKHIMGVCGGLGEYLNLDPTILRVVLLILFFMGGVGFWFYIIIGILLPYDYQVDGYVQKRSTKSESVMNRFAKDQRKDVTPTTKEDDWSDF